VSKKKTKNTRSCSNASFQLPICTPKKKLVLAVKVFWCYFPKFNFLWYFKVIYFEFSVIEKKSKNAKSCLKAFIKYCYKILAVKYSSKNKLVLAASSVMNINPISMILYEFFMLNLKIVGYLFLALIIYNYMRKIPAIGIFFSTCRLALACF
jgi:hypothetical protein